jgi:hypothetical protein
LRKRVWIGSLAAAGCVVIACALWGASVPGPGDRPIEPVRMMMFRAAAFSFAVAGQAVLALAVLPGVYRPRATYRVAGVAGGVITAVAAVTSLALFAATH